jgi:hypothetical protein
MWQECGVALSAFLKDFADRGSPLKAAAPFKDAARAARVALLGGCTHKVAEPTRSRAALQKRGKWPGLLGIPEWLPT